MHEFASHFLISLKGHSLYIYVFIFFISFFESFAFVGLIVPGAVFVVTSGFLAYEGYFNIYYLIAFAVCGAILADIASYFIGEKYYLYVTSLKIYKKYQNYFSAGEAFFKRFGGISVFFGRFVGALRPVVPFSAGMLHMKRINFFFWAVVSGILWGVCYIGAGYFFGEGFSLLNRWMKSIDYAAAAIFLAVIIVYFLRKKSKWNI